MDMIDLAKVVAELQAAFMRRIAAVAADAPRADDGTVSISIDVNKAALHRACHAYIAEIDPASEGSEAATLFAFCHALGDMAALRRAKLAISDPRAKGREVAVLDALIRGDDIEAALRQPAVAPPAETVVPFRRP